MRLQSQLLQQPIGIPNHFERDPISFFPVTQIPPSAPRREQRYLLSPLLRVRQRHFLIQIRRCPHTLRLHAAKVVTDYDVADEHDGASAVDVGQGGYEVEEPVGDLGGWFVVIGGRVGELREAGEDLSAAASSSAQVSRSAVLSSEGAWGRPISTSWSREKKWREGTHPVPQRMASQGISSPDWRRMRFRSSDRISALYVLTFWAIRSKKSAWLRRPPVPFCQNILGVDLSLLS